MPDPDLEIARERIREAAKRKATELDLSRLGLTQVPKEIASLDHLTKLDLHGNNLPSATRFIGRLTDLTLESIV